MADIPVGDVTLYDGQINIIYSVNNAELLSILTYPLYTTGYFVQVLFVMTKDRTKLRSQVPLLVAAIKEPASCLGHG